MKKIILKLSISIIIIIILFITIFIILNNIVESENKEIKVNSPTIGDYVEFNTEEGHIYESLGEINGSYTYTYTSKKINWRILKINSIGQGIVLISENAIKDDLGRNITFKGKLGYWNFEQELNNICSIYGYGTGIKEARSINGDDVNTLIGYDKTKEDDGTESKYGKSYFLFDNGIFLNEDKTEEIASEDNLVEPKFTTYSYIADSYVEKNSKEYELLFKYKDYWLSTRGVGFCSVWAYFNILSVNNEFVAPSTLFSSNGEEFEQSNSVRPIIILNENVKIDVNSGDGSEYNPYKLIVE